MKNVWIAVGLVMVATCCEAQSPPGEARYVNSAAYPRGESAAVWRSLGADYVRKAVREKTLDRDPAWNGRADAVMTAVASAAATLYPRFDKSAWRVLLIDDFGHGAVAFPGGTLLVDAKFVRQLKLTDDELALVFAHEVAHVVADHPSEKLSFMAEYVGREKAPTARSALLEFFAHDYYAEVFQPTALLQEREADAIGATILCASGFDARRSLELFDKLSRLERGETGRAAGTHDAAQVRKRAVAAVIDAARKP